MSELALPDPQTTALAHYGEVVRQAAAIRAYCAEQDDAKTADELRRRLAAFERYVKDREVRNALAVESRMTERLIGLLLGPPERGGDRHSTQSYAVTLSDLNTRLRVEFRRLAWREDGTELPEADFLAFLASATQRSKLLSAIERARLARLAPIGEEAPPADPADPAKVYLEDGVHLAEVGEALELVAPDSVDVIVTDPPYDEAAVASYAELAAFAGHVLRPGGSLAVMVGQFHLPAAISHLGALELHYHWTLAYLTPGGQAPQIFPRRVNTFWKPVLWFVKGVYEGPWLGDVVRSAVNDNDKTHHRWGQSESGMSDLVERLSSEGELVCDPYCGAGTTGVVSLRLGRRFLGFDRDPDEVGVARGRLLEEGLGA